MSVDELIHNIKGVLLFCPLLLCSCFGFIPFMPSLQVAN